MYLMNKERLGRVAGWVLLAALGLGTAYYLFFFHAPAAAAFSPARHPGETLIVDAGHGGEDGGAVSITGVPESGVNLAIALKLDQILGLYGAPPTLLRSEDISIHDPSAGTLREKKVSDLHNRVALVNELPGAVLLSIHQNSLPSSPSTRGAQVFWNRQEGAEELASSIQESLNGAVNAGHEKKAAQVPSSVYLMKEITAPGVLVECGFLSNAAETEQLKDPAYQTKLAAAIAAGVLNSDKR